LLKLAWLLMQKLFVSWYFMFGLIHQVITFIEKSMQ
jgi:hypothetical protein